MYGKNTWLIADGFMSDTECGGFVSHESICVLNLSGEEAHITMTVYFEDAEPLRGLHASCAHERSHHIRLDKLVSEDGRKIPKNVPHSVLVESDRPIAVQVSRLDVTQPEYTLMTTIPFSV
jgi:hypothetical protein